MRVTIYTHDDEVLGDIPPDMLHALVRTEEVNGQNCLDITTTLILEREQRVLIRDGMGKWREYVVNGVDEDHQSGGRPIGTYNCIWSLQHDLQIVAVSAMPGVQTPVRAAVALEAALSTTARWNVGTVTQTTSGGASMYRMSAWDALSVLVDTWGGEVDAQIDVDSDGVISRKVALYAHAGSGEATRRFDYSEDITGIRRKVEETPIACRIIPLGKGEESESGGYGRKIDISSVNDGKDYLQNDEVVEMLRLPDGEGGWEYPTVFVENSKMETPAELKEWGQSVIGDYTTPKVTYEANVVQLAKAGMSPQGVALGDVVHCVDRGFDPPIRTSGRVVKMVVDELVDWGVTLTIGHLGETFARRVNNLASNVASVTERVEGIEASTAEVLDGLLDTLNSEINANGGYTYITDGQGIRTYDKAVSDPLVGAEADMVTELKGGTIRFADSRTASGDWDWRTVITSGHIAADMVTAANLTAGYIGSPSGNYWNLDTGELHMQSISDEISEVGDAAATAQEAAEAAQEAAEAAAAESKKSVGGTNLLIDSGLNTLAKRAADADRYWSNNSNASNAFVALASSTRPTGGASYAARLSIPANQVGKHDGICYYNGKSVRLLDGAQYTVSCWARVTSGSASILFQYGQTSYVASAKQALDGSWRQYSWTFSFDQSRAGGSNGARVYFYAMPSSSAASVVEICAMKAESGAKATGWALAPEDVNHGITNAAALAKTYTNAISQADRAYTSSQRQALDESFNQEKIFNRLTDGGRAQGLVLSNGKLYVNGEYIQTNTLDAGIIKTGLLVDRAGKNKWNLETGYFYTQNGELHNCTVNGQLTSGTSGKAQFNNGTVRFFNGTKNAVTIDGALQFNDGGYGGHITFDKYLVLRGPGLATTTNVKSNGTLGFTGSVTLQNITFGMNSNMSKCSTGNIEFKFINGLFVGIGSYTTNMARITKRSGNVG